MNQVEPGPLIPPAELMRVVGSPSEKSYLETGRHFLSLFERYGGLKPAHRVLDVGCGCGRIAQPLARYLTTGSYEGFDVVPELVAWCEQNIAPRHPNFRFLLADVANGFYYEKGGSSASRFRFPYEDRAFDFAILTSVFTHMLQPEFERYAAEIARVLKPGGAALMTFFLLNDESRRMKDLPGSQFEFGYRRGFRGLRVQDRRRPEAAVAYPERTVRAILDASGFDIRQVLFGAWCGRSGALSGQDVVIAQRRPERAPWRASLWGRAKRLARATLGAAAFAAIVASGEGALAAGGGMVVRSPALDSEIALRTCERFAGAVCSVTFRGKEHIDTKDHGRLLQSASFLDGHVECYNPTEAGSLDDVLASSSVLKAARVEGNRVWTITDMAFWLRPGQTSRDGCGGRGAGAQAVNTVALSGHLLEKSLTVGLPEFPNVIEHRVTFYLPTRFARATFEASTGYMPKEFSLALYYDPTTGSERDPGARHGEQSLPVTLATPDRRHAMGVYSAELPQGRHGYGRFVFRDVVKWNCVFRERDVGPGAYSYRCLVILGSVAEVQDAMRRLAGAR